MATSISLLEKYTQKGDILNTVKDYERSPAAQLFRRVIKETAGSNNTIAGFDNWVEKILPEQIKEQNFVSDSGVTVTFSDIFLNKPSRVVNNKEVLMYPKFCREYKFPYTGKLELTCTTEKGKDKRVIKINLGIIPIMLGSKKCNLYGKTAEELVELGECITDPFGYFIVSSEWALVTHDKKRRNIPYLVFNKKINSKTFIINQYTVRNKTTFIMGDDWNTIQLVDPVSRPDEKNKKTFPIFIIFKIINDLEPEQVIEDYIFRFIDKKLYRRARIALQASIFEYNTIRDPELYVYGIRNEYKHVKGGIDKKAITDNIGNSLESDIFVNLNTEKNKDVRIEKKKLVLSYMLSRYVLYMLGEIEKDNPDSWANKRFDNAHIHMEQLFCRIFVNVLNKCKKKTNKDRGKPEANINFINFGDYLNSKSKDEFKKIFETSFNTSTWGVKNEPSRRENYREQVRRDTPMALWSQIVKNTNNIPTNGTVVAARVIQPTQRNKHCIMETPEGQTVGIVKFNCISGIFSLCRDEKEINEMIIKYGNSYNEEFNILPLVNGFPVSDEDKILYADKNMKDILIAAKRKQTLPFDIEIYFNRELNTLEIFCDSSRTITPYLIVNPKTNNLVIDEINGWDLDYQTLTTNGCIEFLGPREEIDRDVSISCSVENFYAKKREITSSDTEDVIILKRNYSYSHCSIDPMQMFSLATTTCPLSNHQLAPRTSFQASMCKQALGYYNINYHLRFKTFKQLYKAERSLCETDTYFLPMMDLFPAGQIANVAFLCDTDNQEDAVVVSEDYINAGNLNYIKYQVVEIVVPTNTKGYTIKHKIPPLKKNEDPYIYRHIQENGLPKMDSLIETGDCILGQVLVTSEGEENHCTFADLDIYGYVDRILITRERNGTNPLIRIKLRNYNKYKAGDKLALRYAQKGTIGRVAKREELPVVSDGPNKGIVPDILFNPHGFPTRQTAGLMIEGLLSKAALYDCKRRDVSSFRSPNLEEAKQVLRDNGLDEFGYENMESSKGVPLKERVNLVPLTEQVLKHQVKDKFQYRNIGPRDFRTHQPRSGRSKGGGIRAGEMEKDSFAAHGASSVIRERMMKSSDEFKMIVCNNCGVIINYKFCTVCNNSEPVVVLIPYVFKVLLRLLNGVGIDIRLKTEKVNIFRD